MRKFDVWLVHSLLFSAEQGSKACTCLLLISLRWLCVMAPVHAQVSALGHQKGQRPKYMPSFQQCSSESVLPSGLFRRYQEGQRRWLLYMPIPDDGDKEGKRLGRPCFDIILIMSSTDCIIPSTCRSSQRSKVCQTTRLRR